MTEEERGIILDLMKKQRFDLTISDLKSLCFQKIENKDVVQVTLSSDFPFYVENKYGCFDVPDYWAKKTLMLKNFEKLKTFAEFELKRNIDNLKAEFRAKLERGKTPRKLEIEV